MESEIELNDAVQELHVVATQSDLYPVLVNMNGVTLLMGLLSHENTDISIAVISLLQELTDVDTLTESEQQATFLIDALVGQHESASKGTTTFVSFQAEQQIVSLLVQNMDRLDEDVKEEADGIHNSLGDVTLEQIAQHTSNFPSSHCGEHDGISANILCRCL